MSKPLISFVLGCVVGAVATVVAFIVFGPKPETTKNSFGRFVGELKVTLLDDGRKMRLDKDYAYIDVDDKIWNAPTTREVDGASIPQAFWSIIGGPLDGPYRNASVIHDIACDDKTEPSDDVHRMFYFACRANGVSEAKAKAMYYAVSRFGPKWKIVRETRAFTTAAGTTKMIEIRKPVEIVDPQTVTKEEAATVVRYFEKNNPSLKEIPTLEIPQGR